MLKTNPTVLRLKYAEQLAHKGIHRIRLNGCPRLNTDNSPITQDGIFMVKAQTNKILDFDKYSLAVLCDGRVVGVEARASIKADSVDAFVGKLLSILKTKYGRICLQQSCDRDIWKIFFPDREHPRGMSGVDVNIVPMSSEVGVIVDRPRQGNSLAVVYLFARDVRLWNDCHKVHAQKVAEENERARQKALDAL